MFEDEDETITEEEDTEPKMCITAFDGMGKRIESVFIPESYAHSVKLNLPYGGYVTMLNVSEEFH
jgi:hypothetical protein